MSNAQCPSSELDPVVIEYATTVQRIRKEGESALDGWMAKLLPCLVRARVSTWRASQHPSPDSDKLKQLLLDDQ